MSVCMMGVAHSYLILLFESLPVYSQMLTSSLSGKLKHAGGTGTLCSAQLSYCLLGFATLCTTLHVLFIMRLK